MQELISKSGCDAWRAELHAQLSSPWPVPSPALLCLGIAFPLVSILVLGERAEKHMGVRGNF